MSEGIFFEDGQYSTPVIGRGGEHTFPESSFYVEGGEFGVESALFGDRKGFSEIFRDPRAANFVDAAVRHGFHHLDTRQLSLPERFETRSGSGRMNRLTTLVESARMAANVGGTFEQVVQIMMSDYNVTVGSHRLGDHLEGDYATQTTRDTDIADYMQRSGFQDYLEGRGIVDSGGGLAGSPVNIFSLTDPNNPRGHDIVECPRPYSNADRDPFTLFEALYLVDEKEVQEAAGSIIRVEIPNDTDMPTGTQERLAYTDIDAARLLFKASVRHATEHWGNPEHHLVEETTSIADKHRLMQLWPYAPIDYVRTSESEWFDGVNDEFAEQLYVVAEGLARAVREATWGVQNGERDFKGPGEPKIPGISFRKVKPVDTPRVLIARDTRYDTNARLTVFTPAHKRRAPIDPLVAHGTDMQHLLQIEPELREYAEKQSQWLGSYAITAQLPWEDIGGLQDTVRVVRNAWSPRNGRPEPMLRVPMGKDMFSDQIAKAREAVRNRSFTPH